MCALDPKLNKTQWLCKSKTNLDSTFCGWNKSIKKLQTWPCCSWFLVMALAIKQQQIYKHHPFFLVASTRTRWKFWSSEWAKWVQMTVPVWNSEAPVTCGHVTSKNSTGGTWVVSTWQEILPQQKWDNFSNSPVATKLAHENRLCFFFWPQKKGRGCRGQNFESIPLMS